MRPVFLPALSIALFCATLSASALTPVRHRSPATHAVISHPHSQRVSAVHLAMDTERATQIQDALIKSGYLSGEASGNWDAQSMAAMQKLQADNGWQTKIVPDSRALIKLGLGPQSHHN